MSTYADLAKLLDLPPTDDPALQIRLLQERRAEQLDALAANDREIIHPTYAALIRARRKSEVHMLEAALALAGAPLEPEDGADG